MKTKGRLDLEDYGKYYSAQVRCFNCRTINHCYILKGIPAYKIAVGCSNCGCKIDMQMGAYVEPLGEKYAKTN